MSTSIEPGELFEPSPTCHVVKLEVGLSWNILKQLKCFETILGTQCDILILLDNLKRSNFSEQIFTLPIIIIVLGSCGKCRKTCGMK